MSQATIEPSERPRLTQPVWNLPNLLTLSRLGLAVVLFACISFEQWWYGLAVFVVAAWTDWMDGYLARKHGTGSAFGRNFDPLVDKVLIGGAFIFLLPVKGSGLAAWMVTLVVARELIVTGLRGFFESNAVNFGADFLGKLKMGLQCAALIAILLVLAVTGTVRETLESVQLGLIWAMLAATALSGLQYVVKALTIMRAF
jgi:CDP-diacylglycerol--glycerol-3-phosphate 3-phosphatidyltransferase